MVQAYLDTGFEAPILATVVETRRVFPAVFVLFSFAKLKEFRVFGT